MSSKVQVKVVAIKYNWIAAVWSPNHIKSLLRQPQQPACSACDCWQKVHIFFHRESWSLLLGFTYFSRCSQNAEILVTQGKMPSSLPSCLLSLCPSCLYSDPLTMPLEQCFTVWGHKDWSLTMTVTKTVTSTVFYIFMSKMWSPGGKV